MEINDIIQSRRRTFIDNLEKSFGVDIEKAFPVGTIRVWDGVQYRKVNDGEWVKVDKKEKSVATSGMIKKFKSDLEDADWNLHKIRSDIDARIKEKFEKEKPELKGKEFAVTYKVAFSKFKNDNLKNDPYYVELQEQLSKYEELSDEIRVLDIKFREEQKLKREEKHGGRKELNDKDVVKLLSTISSKNFYAKRITDDNGSPIPAQLSCKEFYNGIVSAENYYMCTNADFEMLEVEKWERLDGVLKQTFNPYDTFNKMKESGKFDYTHSPKSDSEYLVDKKEGIVYRIADHWGRCASCNWGIKDNDDNYIPTGRYVVLAKCRFKDMEMTNDYYHHTFDNPKYIEKYIEIGRKEIEKVSNLIGSDDVYFTDKAKKVLESSIDAIEYNYRLKYNGILEKMVDDLIFKFNNIP